MENTSAVVVSVGHGAGHAFSKPPRPHVDLTAGMGVEGYAHFGGTVRHRSRVAIDPTQPNLRQAHLLHCELFTMLAAAGFRVAAGDLGENVTTAGIDLLSLPVGTLPALGSASVEITGFDGVLNRLAWIMAIVKSSGGVTPADRISVTRPPLPHRRVDRV